MVKLVLDFEAGFKHFSLNLSPIVPIVISETFDVEARAIYMPGDSAPISTKFKFCPSFPAQTFVSQMLVLLGTIWVAPFKISGPWDLCAMGPAAQGIPLGNLRA